MKNKTLRNDIILIGSLLLIFISIMIGFLLTSSSKNLIANIYVSNNLVETIDLSKKENKDYKINGTHGEVIVRTKDGAIAIIESTCPHHDCINVGYVKETNKPIICAYNEVYIVVLSSYQAEDDIKI